MAVMSAGGPTFFHGSFPLPSSVSFRGKMVHGWRRRRKTTSKRGEGEPPPPLNNNVLPASSRPSRPAPPCRESNGENIFLHPVFYPLPPSFRLCPRYLFPFFATVPAPPPALPSPSPSRQVPSSSFFSPPSSILLLPLPATTTGEGEKRRYRPEEEEKHVVPRRQNGRRSREEEEESAAANCTPNDYY